MAKVLLLAPFVCLFTLTFSYVDEKEETLPTKCHVCKHMTRELVEELVRSGKSKDVLYMGQVFQKQPKKIPYQQSELRLTEALENACSNVLEYKVHKDKPLPFRYEKVESTTFKTLKGLKNKGVKVDLGFPDELWDTPDAEVTRLKSKCEQMVEQYEDDISHWYWNMPDSNLTQWLCVNKILKSGENNCLNETANQNRKIWKREQEMKSNEKEEKQVKEPDLRLDEQQSKGKLIQQQGEEPNERSDGITKAKREALRDRLRSIVDPNRLREEIRKIRNKELKDYESYPVKSDDVHDLRREIENRALSLQNNNDVRDSLTIHEMLQIYIEDAKSIRDKNELRRSLEDLNALTGIIGNRDIHNEL
ncbi:protein canopy 4 [Exaiptasia diaphana]|uniref:DUF3456 domain-containing protein n=1 Tax=Exaiptasia diaphana TaxID=2652724 RepID=A0A913Y0V1_EXADI|nr:protein canopy 4 [Exaiptasia diaphana]KXJ07759.1 Protein canopy 4 [Exaiptasia diaphana]